MAHAAALRYLGEILEPLEFVVWGEVAMARLGVPLVPHSIMLVPSEQNYATAVNKVEQAGFRNAPWSYGSTDPAIIEAAPDPGLLRRVHAAAGKHYRMLDTHSKRYEFPPSKFDSLRLLFLHSSYVELGPPDPLPIDDASQQDSSMTFTSQGIYHFPCLATLLESFIRTALKDGDRSTWYMTLFVWITSYVCVSLAVKPDALNHCEDERVREEFGKLIKNDYVTRWDRSKNPVYYTTT